MDSKVKVLLIAGLDSGNGAGITADCMTVTDFNVWPLSCVSAVTVQSLKRIVEVESVSTRVFSDTLEVLLSDFENIKAVKVGLISDARQLDTVISFLGEKLPNVPVVWDPVLCGTAGDLNSCDIKSNLKKILPLVTIFTPNLIEAMELLDWDSERVKKEGIEALADEFIKLGAMNVIIKGGHNLLNTDATDTFKGSEFTFSMSHERVEGEGAHGGGCALSSALASLLSLGYAPHDAAVVASAYVYSGIKNPAFLNDFYRPPIGHTRVIDDLKLMPFVREEGFPVSSEPFKKCPLKLGLYPVVDSYEWIERLTALGIKTIQLRIKDKERPTLYEEIEKSVELCRKRRVRLFIDDHYELAIKAKAYGVHLGMEDLKTADLNKIREAGLRLGVSTHGAYEMQKTRQLNPSYIALGHIFPTNSKVMPSKPQGVLKLEFEQNLIKDTVPTVAIGGIKLFNVDDVLKTKVGSVALITGITKASDPDKTALEWLEKVGCGDEYED